MKNNNEAWNVNNDGTINFNTNSKVMKMKSVTATIWEDHKVGVLIGIVMCAIDFALIKGMLASFLIDDPIMQAFALAGFLAGFDILPILFGANLKYREQGYNKPKWFGYLTITVFIVALTLNFILRYYAKDVMLPPDSYSGMSTFGSVSTNTTSNPMALSWALTGGFLPVITSVVSFAASYFSSDPLKWEYMNLETQKFQLEENQRKIKAVIKEYEADRDFKERVLADDERKYNEAVFKAKNMASTYADYVRERIKEHIGNPVATSELSIKGEPLSLYDGNSLSKIREGSDA